MRIEVYTENGICIVIMNTTTKNADEMILEVDAKLGKDNWDNFRVNNDQP